MKMQIVDVICPICKSAKCRSKVEDKNGVWWFICDNPLCLKDLVVDSKIIDIEPRFYFTLPKDYKHVYIEYTDKVSGHTHLAYKKYNNWYEQK